MTALLTWLSLLAVGTMIPSSPHKLGIFFNRFKNRLFLFIVFLLGATHILGVFDIQSLYLLKNSFEQSGLSDQMAQALLAMPIITIFSQSLERIEKDNYMTPIFMIGSIAAINSYNINIIIVTLLIFEFLSIERNNAPMKDLRRDLSILLLTVAPLSLGNNPFLPEMFFFLIIVLSILDIFSSPSLQSTTFLFPLRMTILAYYASSPISPEYLNWGRIIFFTFILIAYSFGVFSHFNRRFRLVIAQLLMLAISLSSMKIFYMDLYFIITFLLIYGVDDSFKGKSITWPFIGPLLIVLFSFVGTRLSIVTPLALAFQEDIYSKLVGGAFLLFLTLLTAQWGRSLKNIKDIKLGTLEKYYLSALVLYLILCLPYNPPINLIHTEWTGKVITLFYFIIVFLCSYIIRIPTPPLYNFKIPEVYDKKLSSSSLLGFLEKTLLFLSDHMKRGLLFVQNTGVKLFFTLVDSFERKRVRKYQHLAIVLLITFLLLWIKIFAGRP